MQRSCYIVDLNSSMISEFIMKHKDPNRNHHAKTQVYIVASGHLYEPSKHHRKNVMTQKKETWKWCSRYTRLRDAIDYCKRAGIDLHQFSRVEDTLGQCCSCGKVKAWIGMDAGHFISRGTGGWSGVYFDERNINLQCKPCNGFLGGNIQNYTDFMKQKYGQDVIDELRFLDKNNSYKGKLIGLELYYKQKYKEMAETFERER